MKKTKLLLAFILLLALVGCKKKEPPKPPVVVDPDVESVEITNTETTLGVGSHVITARALPEGSSQLLRITLVGTFEGVSIDDSTLTISPETQDKLEITVRVISLYDPTKSNTKVFTVDNQIDYVEIRTEADLRAIETSENGLSKNYLLMNHIELTGEWDPIGVADKELDDGSVVKGNPFMGIFNGQGYTISGIKMSEGEFNEGFFAQIGPGGVVRNVTLKGNISAIGWTGGVTGINEGKISNVAAHIDVSVQNTSAAALVCVNRGVIEYSYATGKTTSSLPLSSPRSAGLIVVNSGTLKHVYGDKDTIESPNYLSGSPVGDDLYMLSTALMKTASTFSSFDTDIWFLKDGFYPLLKHEGFVEPTEKEKSLVVNNENLMVNAVLENEVVIDVTLVNGDLEDVLVYTLKEEVLGVSIAGNVVSLTTEVVHLSTFTVIITLEGTEISKEVTFTVRNNPDSANTVVEITTEEEFLALQRLDADSAEYTYKLMNDIALTGWYTQTIGNAEIPFMGTFDGQGFTISGFKGGDSENNFAIFGVIGTTGVVKNLGIKGAEREVDFYRGNTSAFLASKNYGLIENVYVEATIMSGGDLVAGIVGENHGTIKFVLSRVKVYKNDDFIPGTGFALINTGTITNSYVDQGYTNAPTYLSEASDLDVYLLTTEAFTSASTYAGFDLNIWLIVNGEVPKLKPQI